MVGGVSIGAFMGGLWCMERNVTSMTQKARSWAIVSIINEKCNIVATLMKNIVV